MGAYLEIKSEGAELQTPLQAGAIRASLQCLIGSQTFRAARAQRNFLSYVVEETLAGRGDLIKEYSIGVEVFGRGKSFDPRVNNIVRAEATRLRSKLAKYYETEGKDSSLRIELPKGGYAPIFIDKSSLTPPPVTTSELGEEAVRTLPDSRGWKMTAIALMVVLFAGIFALLVSRIRPANQPSLEGPSVAVLPFVNLSGNKEDEFFSDGLTDELIDTLGRVRGLQVVARTSAFQFKGKIADVRQIGQKLNVGTVLEGTIRKYGDRLRITAQLDNATTGYKIWSESYDRDAKDALAIQREISQAITDALGVALARSGSPHQEPAPDSALTVDPPAYEAYLKGLFFWNKNTPESIKTAIDYFEQAIARDSAFALPHLGLARCYAGMAVLTATPSSDLVPKLRSAAQRALDLDPSLGEAHVDLGEAYTFDYEWKAAETEFKAALQQSPGSAVAHRWYAYYLVKMGRLEEALAENKRALELDPVSPYMSQGMADSLHLLGRYDEAVASYQKIVALEPNFGMTREALGMSFIMSRRYAEGVAELKLARQIMGSSPWTDGQLAYAYAMGGNASEARRMLNELLRQANSGPFQAAVIAQIYIGLGDFNRAFAWLQKAVDAHEVQLKLKADPIFDPLRSDPRFAELLRRMKLS